MLRAQVGSAATRRERRSAGDFVLPGEQYVLLARVNIEGVGRAPDDVFDQALVFQGFTDYMGTTTPTSA